MSRKEYIKNYQRNWLRKRREDFFSNKSCVLCGATTHLELDHVNPEEKITHRIWSRNEKFRNEELSKCQVLCKSCHQQKSINYCKQKFTGKDLKANHKISDELFLQVVELNKSGLSLRKACEQLKISYSTFSSAKSRNRRVFK